MLYHVFSESNAILLSDPTTSEVLLVQCLSICLTLLLRSLLLGAEVLRNGGSWLCFVVTELDLVSLWWSLIMERVVTGIGIGLTRGIFHDMLRSSTGWVVIGLLWSGRHDEFICRGTLVVLYRKIEIQEDDYQIK